MSKLSRTKGHTWERQVVRMMKDAFPDKVEDIRRGLQYRDGEEAADVIFPAFHIECKVGRAPQPFKALEQATRDAKGKLMDIGHYAVPSFPRAFAIDVDGTFLYVAGQRDGKVAAYRIKHTGALLPIERIDVGAKPSWVLCTTSEE